MAGLEVRISRGALQHLETLIREAGKKAPQALMRAINHTGDIARTRMRRELVKQTGLRLAVITKALKVKRAGVGGAYVISSAGGNIRLKYFGARETGSGVSAAPWAHREVFAGTFIKGGRFPNRVDINKGGQVFVRTGDKRLPDRGGEARASTSRSRWSPGRAKRRFTPWSRPISARASSTSCCGCFSQRLRHAVRSARSRVGGNPARTVIISRQRSSMDARQV